MRKYAFLKQPLQLDNGASVFKIMLCEAAEWVYLFEYCSPKAVQCSFDCCYDSLEDLYDAWNDLIDEKGWLALDDPLPDCQQDAFIPLRVKGRDRGTPEWGSFETLQDGIWVAYRPEK